MARFISCTELYKNIQQKSSETKEILWICSPNLGSDAHEVFSQEIARNPPTDARFVFGLSEAAVKRGKVDPYEVQYFNEHFKTNSVRSDDSFHSSLYIFDSSALITSANLTKTAFESNIEVGVFLDDEQVDAVKKFFTSLWEGAKPVKDVKKYKRMWNIEKKSESKEHVKPSKPHTKIDSWTNNYANMWYLSIPSTMAKKTERKIVKESAWPKNLKIVADIGPSTFKQVKLGDLALIADLTKKRASGLKLELARIIDKNRVETDEGDLHFAYETEKTCEIERANFYDILKKADITPRSSEILLNQDQATFIINILSSIKARKRNKHRTKNKPK